MKFKVGDKVWLLDLGKKAIIKEIAVELLNLGGYYFDEIDKDYCDGLGLTENEFCDTFDTMITRLGFEKITNTQYSSYSEENKYFYYTVIINNDKTYTIYNWFSQLKIDKPLHEALTQLMVELEAK